MGIFYSVSSKDLLMARKTIFESRGILALKNNGFVRAPFQGAHFGRNNIGGYSYQLWRLTEKSELEMVLTHIAKKDRWIKCHLNIFQLVPKLKSLEQLQDINGVQFLLTPNNRTEMRLDVQLSEGTVLSKITRHKIRSFFSKSGFEERIRELERNIEGDMRNIQYFIDKWHMLHTPLVTDWNGNGIR